eukprot:TRINITY_DN4777_c0_g1_i1.p1 TRINITY_DN4777_c0_g1~~TRINITY_DN4777_c0_g1_i1.p1  ORF type:complete len:194 (-),score=54.14 TRINITY_DN4777_c0_g1_i1:225-806(-)
MGIKYNKIFENQTMKIFAVLLLAACLASTQSRWVKYDQCDARWAMDLLPHMRSMCKEGFYTTAVAMALASYNIPCGESPCTPKGLDKYLKLNHGYKNEDPYLYINFDVVAKLPGVKHHKGSGSNNFIRENLSRGACVGCDFNWTYCVVITGFENDGDDFTILHPKDTKKTTISTVGQLSYIDCLEMKAPQQTP